jgi:hypothetical protein
MTLSCWVKAIQMTLCLLSRVEEKKGFIRAKQRFGGYLDMIETAVNSMYSNEAQVYLGVKSEVHVTIA